MDRRASIPDAVGVPTRRARTQGGGNRIVRRRVRDVEGATCRGQGPGQSVGDGDHRRASASHRERFGQGARHVTELRRPAVSPPSIRLRSDVNRAKAYQAWSRPSASGIPGTLSRVGGWTRASMREIGGASQGSTARESGRYPLRDFNGAVAAQRGAGGRPGCGPRRTIQLPPTRFDLPARAPQRDVDS